MMPRLIRVDLHISLLLNGSLLRSRASRLRLRASKPNSSTYRSNSVLWTKRHISSTASPRQSQSMAEASLPTKTGALQVETPVRHIAAPEGAMAIVFTDVVKSTDLWETNVEAMKAAMVQHDEELRNLIVRHNGYEVKQNGDGFMIAFQTAIRALEFCLEVQQHLLEVEWPEELLEMKAGSEVTAQEGDHEEVLFKGLRLRMSCHWGEPVAEPNRVTDRMDYFGPMVNRAARFIQATEGGQIVVSEPFLAALGRAKNGVKSDESSNLGPLFGDKYRGNDDVLGQALDLRDLQAENAETLLRDKHFEVRLLGKRHFKGVSDLQKLYFITSESLNGRIQFWPKHAQVEGSKGNLIEPG